MSNLGPSPDRSIYPTINSWSSNIFQGKLLSFCWKNISSCSLPHQSPSANPPKHNQSSTSRYRHYHHHPDPSHHPLACARTSLLSGLLLLPLILFRVKSKSLPCLYGPYSHPQYSVPCAFFSRHPCDSLDKRRALIPLCLLLHLPMSLLCDSSLPSGLCSCHFLNDTFPGPI